MFQTTSQNWYEVCISPLSHQLYTSNSIGILVAQRRSPHIPPTGHNRLEVRIVLWHKMCDDSNEQKTHDGHDDEDQIGRHIVQRLPAERESRYKVMIKLVD